MALLEGLPLRRKSSSCGHLTERLLAPAQTAAQLHNTQVDAGSGLAPQLPSRLDIVADIQAESGYMLAEAAECLAGDMDCHACGHLKLECCMHVRLCFIS